LYTSSSAFPIHAFKWEAEEMEDLNTLGLVTGSSAAYGINNLQAEYIVGTSVTSAECPLGAPIDRAFRTNSTVNSGSTLLGSTARPNAVARAINTPAGDDHLLSVGYITQCDFVTPCGTDRPVFWDGTTTPEDLSLFDNSAPDADIGGRAWDVNRDREIVGSIDPYNEETDCFRKAVWWDSIIAAPYNLHAETTLGANDRSHANALNEEHVIGPDLIMEVVGWVEDDATTTRRAGYWLQTDGDWSFKRA
jgi:uncharacterized membrane protein